jgi:hypothetical protein
MPANAALKEDSNLSNIAERAAGCWSAWFTAPRGGASTPSETKLAILRKGGLLTGAVWAAVAPQRHAAKNETAASLITLQTLLSPTIALSSLYLNLNIFCESHGPCLNRLDEGSLKMAAGQF